MTPRRIAAALAMTIGGPLIVAVWIWRTVNDIDNAIDGVHWGTCPDVVDLEGWDDEVHLHRDVTFNAGTTLAERIAKIRREFDDGCARVNVGIDTRAFEEAVKAFGVDFGRWDR